MIDNNATNFLKNIIAIAGIANLTYHSNYDLDDLGEMYSPWDGETVNELATGQKISPHEWSKKLDTINKVRDAVLANQYADTTIIAVRMSPSHPLQIQDGIHRAVGIQKALIMNPNVKDTINLRILLFDSENMATQGDYNKLLHLLNK